MTGTSGEEMHSCYMSTWLTGIQGPEQPARCNQTKSVEISPTVTLWVLIWGSSQLACWSQLSCLCHFVETVFPSVAFEPVGQARGLQKLALKRGKLIEFRCLFGNTCPKFAWSGKRLQCIIFRLGVGKPLFLFRAL